MSKIAERPTQVSPNISPSLLAADFGNLASDVERMIEAGADSLHYDVMDGHFVPNMSMGPSILKAVAEAAQERVPLDVHLMVSKPEMWVEPFAKAGANSITFHVEATEDAEALIADMRAHGVSVGVALKPGTDVSSVEKLVPLVDMVLVMTVEPGFGGQKFMVDMMDKVNTLRAMDAQLNIQVDGGLNVETTKVAAQAGANVIVSGSALFKSSDPKADMESMRTSIKEVLGTAESE